MNTISQIFPGWRKHEGGWMKGGTVHLSSPSMAAINPKPRKRRGGVCLSQWPALSLQPQRALVLPRFVSPAAFPPSSRPSPSFPSPFRYGGHPNPRRGVQAETPPVARLSAQEEASHSRGRAAGSLCSIRVHGPEGRR